MSSATKSVDSTLAFTSGENRVVGMMPSRKSVPPSAAGAWLGASPATCRPVPGWMMLPTSSPMASATVDITRK
jgi:hypothetical protein